MQQPLPVCKWGDTLAAIAAVIAARNSCTQRNGGLKAAMSAVFLNSSMLEISRDSGQQPQPSVGEGVQCRCPQYVSRLVMARIVISNIRECKNEYFILIFANANIFIFMFITLCDINRKSFYRLINYI